MNKKPREVFADAVETAALMSTTTVVFTRRRAMDSRRAFRVPRVSLPCVRMPRERTTRSAWSERTRPRRDVRCRAPFAAAR